MVALMVVQIILAVGLVAAVLVQSGTGGLGATFGGSSSYHTKRGVEKGLFYITIGIAIFFTTVSLALVIY